MVPINLFLKILETYCTYFLAVFARPLIYKTCISAFLFGLFCEGKFSYLIVLVPGFCSINGFGWHMILKSSLVNLRLVHLIQ